MIRAKINQEFPHHNIIKHTGDIYVADYTEQTKKTECLRGTEIFDNEPTDIEFLVIHNPSKIDVGTIVFTGESFKDRKGNPKSQCETCLFPYNSNNESWILFAELKYTEKAENLIIAINKAIQQLQKTKDYYLDKSIFDESKNKCYLVISLPKYKYEPFPNFILDVDIITELIENNKVILGLTNSVKILDNKMLDVT